MLPGLRTVVTPKASQARPWASPKSFCRCEWNSIRPGIAVRFAPSTTVPVWAAALCGATERMRLPSITMSTFVARRLAHAVDQLATWTVIAAGRHGRRLGEVSGTSLVAPVSTSTMRSWSIDW